MPLEHIIADLAGLVTICGGIIALIRWLNNRGKSQSKQPSSSFSSTQLKGSQRSYSNTAYHSKPKEPLSGTDILTLIFGGLMIGIFISLGLVIILFLVNAYSLTAYVITIIVGWILGI